MSDARRPQRSTWRAAHLYRLTVFKLDFGWLTGNAHPRPIKANASFASKRSLTTPPMLRCDRMLGKFSEIVSRLAGVAERFCDTLDCADSGFLGDGILDHLPTPSTLGASRVGGVDLNQARIRDAFTAVLALPNARLTAFEHIH